MTVAGVLRRLAAADLALLNRWAATPTPLADQVLPRLTAVADHGVLWCAVAGTLAAFGRDRGRRAAALGVTSLTLTSAVVNLTVKRAFRRGRPPVDGIPLARRLARQPVTGSFPSGHAASAGAFATAVSAEWPALAPPLGLAAAGVAWSRVHTGAHFPSDCAAGLLLGTATALAVRRVGPRAVVAWRGAGHGRQA